LVDVSVTVSLIRNHAGASIGVSRIHRDITERRRAEDQIHRREQELSDFFENATIGFHWTGPDGIILRANHAELEMLGYASEEYVGRHIADFHADWEMIETILRRLHSGEAIRNQPALMIHKDGSIREVLIDSSVRWENGRFAHTQCFTRDVTEINRSQVARLESERMARSVLDSLSANIAVLDDQGSILEVNRSWIDFAEQNQATGCVNEDANYLRVCDEAVGQEAANAALFAAGIRDVLTGSRPSFSLEYPCHSPTQERWFVGRVLPFLGDGPKRVVVTHIDVTESKLADEALGNYADRLETLSRQLLRAQEDERRRIAHELHDEVGQSLTAAKIAVDRFAGMSQPSVAGWQTPPR
jgi:PAS domain S-box-containing protein